MAGRGPAPKDPARRAGKAADPTPVTKIEKVTAPQPKLPGGRAWHARTRQWWRVWGASPQAEHFTAEDWDFLLDTAMLHHRLWAEEDVKLAAEIRLRVAKYGATPEDRMRLRMHYADPAEGKPEPPAGQGQPASRWGDLRAVDSA